MKVSLMNEKIVIQKSSVIADTIGNRKNVWEDYYSCFATITGEDGNEKSEAGQTVMEEEVAFTVRYCKSVMAINTAEYRIVFRGQLYNIISVNHMNFKKKSVKFKCQRARR